MARIDVESIRAELALDNWELVSDKYKNLDEELIYKCSEGHTVYGPWKKFRTKRKCPVCAKNIYKEQIINAPAKSKDEKRLLALDQATYVTGYAIYSNGELLKYGTFETDLENEIARDHEIKEWLINIVNAWKIDKVALEGIQYQANQAMGVTTFETLARLQGILMETLFLLKIPFILCPTNTWRYWAGVKGKSRADRKRSMQLLVKQWFDVSVSDDCADAIGIGKYVIEKTPEEFYIEKPKTAKKVKLNMVSWE